MSKPDRPTPKHAIAPWSRAGIVAVLSSWMALAWSSALVAGEGTAVATHGGLLCGRGGDVSQLLVEMQKPSAERLWRDTKLFVLRDHDDGTLWAFSIKKSTVHPAVRCRRAITGAAAQNFEIGQICPSGDAACASFAAQADEKFDSVGSGRPAR